MKSVTKSEQLHDMELSLDIPSTKCTLHLVGHEYVKQDTG